MKSTPDFIPWHFELNNLLRPPQPPNRSNTSELWAAAAPYVSGMESSTPLTPHPPPLLPPRPPPSPAQPAAAVAAASQPAAAIASAAVAAAAVAAARAAALATALTAVLDAVLDAVLGMTTAKLDQDWLREAATALGSIPESP